MMQEQFAPKNKLLKCESMCHLPKNILIAAKDLKPHTPSGNTTVDKTPFNVKSNLNRKFTSKINLSGRADSKSDLRKIDAFYDQIGLDTCNKIDLAKLHHKKKSLFNLNALDLDINFDNISLSSFNSNVSSSSNELDNNNNKEKDEKKRTENDALKEFEENFEKAERRSILLKWLQELN